MKQLLEQLRRFRDERNWAQFHTPKDLAISVSVEANELLEIFQWRPTEKELSAEEVEKISSEAADVLLYLILLCDQAGIDIEEAADAKLKLNQKRFPIEVSHGIAKPTDARGE